MKSHLAGIALGTLFALVFGTVGFADTDFAVYVVGGTVCNHSDYVTYDCEEINGRSTSCLNAHVGADTVQTCKDILVESHSVCTENNCKNVTKDQYVISSCTEDGCSGQ